MSKPRRKYSPGICRDCGWRKNVTEVIFWVNGMKYQVCAKCIKPYRKVILKPCAPDCAVCKPTQEKA